MSGQDAHQDGRHGLISPDQPVADVGDGVDDSWPDAPTPSWLPDEVETPGDLDVSPDTAVAGAATSPETYAAYEPYQPYPSSSSDTYAPETYDSYDLTASVGAYDLGPDTASYVVDLTGRPPEAHHAPLAPATEVALAAPVVDEPRSRHAAPRMPAATERPDFNIPPVPSGSDQNQAETLTAATVLRTRKPRPQSGWRKGVLNLTGGRVNLGLSPQDRRRADLIERARTPVVGCHRLAVISLKGGVGKTTTTAALGAVFAMVRGDRVIAVDANPDRGTLIERVPRESGATVRHLLEARDRVNRYGDVRAFTSQSQTRLEVLASDADPSASSALSEQDYLDAVETLERFYNLILTDCGTGLLHDAMRGVLGLASSLVVVSSASLDGARSASATLDWLEAHGREALAKDAVVVISSVRPGGGIVDVMQLEDHFAARCRAVVTIPYDPHLEAGGVMDLDELAEDTLDAYKELAAAVGEGFAATNQA